MVIKMGMFDTFLIFMISVIAAVYLFYPLILLATSYLIPSQTSLFGLQKIPKISIIVPTYNEGNVIHVKLKNLLSISYPEHLSEIIVVDSGSTDDTRKAVMEFEKKVILLKQKKRLGKTNALNFALQKATGEIIIINDANSEFQPSSIDKIIQKFDEKTGAVMPRLIPTGRFLFWDKLFFGVHHLYKKLESNSDSVFMVSGKLFAFRKVLVCKINEEIAADDLEIAMSIRKRGYKIKYADDIEVMEKVPDNQKELKTQKTRRAFGIIQVMMNNFDIFINPKYGIYGLLIFPMHFIRMTIAPFFIFLSSTLLIANFIKMILEIRIISTMIILIILIITLALTHCLFLDRMKRIWLFVYNFYATQTYIILALLNLLTGKDYHIWKKVSSTRVN